MNFWKLKILPQETWELIASPTSFLDLISSQIFCFWCSYFQIILRIYKSSKISGLFSNLFDFFFAKNVNNGASEDRPRIINRISYERFMLEIAVLTTYYVLYFFQIIVWITPFLILLKSFASRIVFQPELSKSHHDISLDLSYALQQRWIFLILAQDRKHWYMTSV